MSTAAGGKSRKVSACYVQPPNSYYAVPIPEQYNGLPTTSGTSERRRTVQNGPSAAQTQQLQRQSQQPAANVPRQSVSSGQAGQVRPPDRQREAIEQNTNKANNAQQMAAQAAAQMPKKNRRSTTHIDKKMMTALQQMSMQSEQPPRRGSSSMSAASGARSLSTFDAQPLVLELRAQQQQQQKLPSAAIQKRKKAEVDAFYENIRSRNTLQRLPGRHQNGRSTVRSDEFPADRPPTSSMPAVRSAHDLVSMGSGFNEVEDWSMRWTIDSVGKAPGQLRGPKGVCILQNSGNVVVADSKNARLQVFSGSSGKLLGILGDDSSEQRIATTFRHVSHRKMEPAGLCETPDGSLLVVTDLNRLMYIDAEAKHGGLQGELVMTGKTQLSGVAVTQGNKIILTEVDSTRPFVGLYENNGVMIRAFKGDFRTPTYVAWNEEFEVAAVSDGELQSVMLYDASGKQLNRFSYVPMTPIGNGVSPGIVSAPLCYPAGICWVDANRLLIADRSEHRVFALDIRNFCIEDVLTDSVDGLRYPVAVATNRRNRIVLTEEFYDFGVNEVRLKMFRLMSSETY